MWSFLNPAFLWAAAAAGIPLLLHLLQRRRNVRVPFSTIRFLKLAQKRSANRVRLENLLLWLLRTLLMLLIALAFAMPIVRTQAWGRFFGGVRRDVAIVWDASYSMGYESDRKQVWEDSRAAVGSIIQSLKPGDQVCLFLAADDVVPLIVQPTPDMALALSLVRAQQPRTTSSSLVPAVQAAVEALRNSGPKEREVYIVTDGQALTWAEFRETAATRTAGPAGEKDSEIVLGPEPAKEKTHAAWNPKSLDRNTMFFVALLGADAPQNTAPLQVEVQPSLLMADAPAKVHVMLGHTGPAQNTAVTLTIDDKEDSRRTVFLGEDRGDDAVFTVPGLTPGIHPARVETPADGLALDNSLYFLLRVKDQLPVLVAGSETDAFFLLRALNPRTEASSLKIKRVNPDALEAENLDPYLCVFLCNALPLPGQALQNLERYVKRGGVMIVFPGDHAGPADYAAWGCLPAQPTAIEDAPPESPRLAVRLIKPRDAIFRSMKLPPGTIPMVHIRHQLGWGQLEENGEVILAAGSDQPFLLARNFGKGRVLAFSVSADRSWSDLPLTPFFLPFVHQIAQFSAGAGKDPLYLWTAHNLNLSDAIGDVPEGADLLTPKQETRPIRRLKSETEMVSEVEDVMEPGVYRLTKPGGAAGDPVLAINVDRRESDLRVVPAGEVPTLLGIKTVSVSRDKDDLMRHIEEYRVGRPLSESVFWLVLLLAMLELFVANRQSRKTAGLSERLNVDLAGRVRAKSVVAAVAGAMAGKK